MSEKTFGSNIFPKFFDNFPNIWFKVPQSLFLITHSLFLTSNSLLLYSLFLNILLLGCNALSKKVQNPMWNRLFFYAECLNILQISIFILQNNYPNVLQTEQKTQNLCRIVEILQNRNTNQYNFWYNGYAQQLTWKRCRTYVLQIVHSYINRRGGINSSKLIDSAN